MPKLIKKLSADFRSANSAIPSAMLEVFAENFNPSAQTTLFQSGETALAARPEIEATVA